MFRPSASATTPALHPTEDEWVRFATRELDADTRAAMADHIVACPDCAVVYRAVAEVSRGHEGREPRHEASWGGWRRGLATAASVALAVTGWSWLIRLPDRPAAPAAISTPASSPVPPMAVEPSLSMPTRAAWADFGEPPPVRLPASLTLVTRGPRAREEAFMRDFGPAMTSYRAGRFVEAAAQLAPVVRAHPSIPEGAFYLGYSRLRAGQPSEALEPLRLARASSVVGDDAAWWEAVALEHAGRHDEARATLERLCGGTTTARSRACAALDAVR